MPLDYSERRCVGVDLNSVINTTIYYLREHNQSLKPTHMVAFDQGLIAHGGAVHDYAESGLDRRYEKHHTSSISFAEHGDVSSFLFSDRYPPHYHVHRSTPTKFCYRSVGPHNLAVQLSELCQLKSIRRRPDWYISESPPTLCRC